MKHGRHGALTLFMDLWLGGLSGQIKKRLLDVRCNADIQLAGGHDPRKKGRATPPAAAAMHFPIGAGL